MSILAKVLLLILFSSTEKYEISSFFCEYVLTKKDKFRFGRHYLVCLYWLQVFVY